MSPTKVVGGMSPQFKEEFQKILNLKMPPNDHMALLVECLKKNHLMHTVENINPNLFLTHKNNRGGLLLSPHNVHRNAAKIHAAGASMKNLTNAVAMELPSQGALRLQHIKKNEELITKAAGLLAPINGGERYVSLGCGHTVAFCKTAQAGGITKTDGLKIDPGKKGYCKIDVQALCASPDFATMIHKGWTWEVIPACVDEAFDGFSKIAQKALNTQNNANTPISELEVMMTLEASLSDGAMQEEQDHGEIKIMAVENISAMCAPCSNYAGTLFDFVRLYSGGPGAPHVQFMDSVAKGFGCNVSLGSSFWQGLANTPFKVKTSLFPLVRVALALANMTSDKIEDGVARLLGKTDILKVANKTDEAVEAEEILKDSLEIADAFGGIDVIIKPLGQIFSRMGLKLADREKHGRERACYTMTQLKTLFLKDVGNDKGLDAPLQFDKWNVTAEAAVEATHPPFNKPKPKAPSLEDHGNPVWIAGQSGFKVGKLIVEKGIEINPERIYTIFSIEDTITLHQVISYTRTPSKVTISLSELVTHWTVTMTEPPVEMADPPPLPASIKLDMYKYEILKAILAVSEKKKLPPLAFYRRPDEVRTKTCVKAGGLMLAPQCSIAQLSTKNTSTGTGVSLGVDDGVELFALPVSKPSVPKEPTKWGDGVFSPFWWVTGTTDKKAVNMEFDTITYHGIAVPILKNEADIPEHTRLCYLIKPKAKSKPLQNIIKPSEEEHAPKKKAKRN